MTEREWRAAPSCAPRNFLSLRTHEVGEAICGFAYIDVGLQASTYAVIHCAETHWA
ncbi:MAG: hypothetical protein SVT56_03370 [Chloroflexota bacterium]|nr:hypothetical protein [Chloroflexota bacterium]